MTDPRFVFARSDAANDEALARFAEAVGRVSNGESVVVAVETGNGSASQLVDLIPDEVSLFSKVTCALACRAKSGGVARGLDIDEFQGGAVVLEDAQWADPTSLGRLQRLVREGPHPYLLVVAHQPMSTVDGWWLDQLAETAGEEAALVELTLQETETEAPPATLDSRAIDLIIATRLVTWPVSVPTAAHLLAISEAEVLDLGQELTDQGLVGQARGGFVPGRESRGVDGGEARTGYVADRLASAMEEEGETPAVIGSLRLAAGHPAEAFPPLAEAARDAQSRHATGEAFHLAESALEAAEEAGLAEGPELGELHLISGEFLRSAGRTQWAAPHLEKAASWLEGMARVEALRFAAVVADDGQHPQDAERIIAMAEWEAIRLGETTTLGALLTFHARTLHRLGFAEEADATLHKSEAILAEGGTAEQVFKAAVNKAWIHFDRGEASRAETEFTHVRDEAGPLEGDASVADKEAWRARALFASGHPADALEAIEKAEELATAQDVEAPIFLSHLALAEGSLAFGRHQEALEAADLALDLVERQLPAWENMARSHRASAFLRLGRLEEARDEIDKALEVSPPGANGWRWRTRCQALQMEIATAAGERWPAHEAEDLADLMLQSRLYGWAAELLCAISEHGKRKGAAEEALGLAVHIGRPMIAARAAQAGSLWRDPGAGPVVSGIRAIEAQIPADWEDDWHALPQVAAALAAPEPTDDENTVAATAAMDEALSRAGLADTDAVLSPAQRRHEGLVRRPRRFHPLRLLAATLGIIVIAGGTALGVAELTREEVVAAPTTIPEVTTTLAPALEETQIPAITGSRGFFGVSEHRGGPGRSGVVEWQGPREVGGYYWKIPTPGPVEAGLVTYGTNVYVGTTAGTFYALDMQSGEKIWTMPPEGGISAAPAFGRADIGQGADPMIMVIVNDDPNGIVRAHDATSSDPVRWMKPLGAPIRSSPVVIDGVAMVATTEGFIHALDLLEGNELWVYPEGDEGLGLISADLAYHDETLYVGTQEGILHVIDVSSSSPEQICQFDAINAINANPLVVDDVVYVGTLGQIVWALAPRSCDKGSAANRQFQYSVDAPVTVAPAMVGDIMYLPEGRYLYARNLATNDHLWQPGIVAVAEAPISTSPVVAGDMVYFASEDGVVHAVDAQTGETQWTWQTGLEVRAAPAVVDGVVFIASADGFVYAVGK